MQYQQPPPQQVVVKQKKDRGCLGTWYGIRSANLHLPGDAYGVNVVWQFFAAVIYAIVSSILRYQDKKPRYWIFFRMLRLCWRLHRLSRLLLVTSILSSQAKQDVDFKCRRERQEARHAQHSYHTIFERESAWPRILWNGFRLLNTPSHVLPSKPKNRTLSVLAFEIHALHVVHPGFYKRSYKAVFGWCSILSR